MTTEDRALAGALRQSLWTMADQRRMNESIERIASSDLSIDEITTKSADAHVRVSVEQIDLALRAAYIAGIDAARIALLTERYECTNNLGGKA